MTRLFRPADRPALDAFATVCFLLFGAVALLLLLAPRHLSSDAPLRSRALLPVAGKEL